MENEWNSSLCPKNNIDPSEILENLKQNKSQIQKTQDFHTGLYVKHLSPKSEEQMILSFRKNECLCRGSGPPIQ